VLKTVTAGKLSKDNLEATKFIYSLCT